MIFHPPPVLGLGTIGHACSQGQRRGWELFGPGVCILRLRARRLELAR